MTSFPQLPLLKFSIFALPLSLSPSFSPFPPFDLSEIAFLPGPSYDEQSYVHLGEPRNNNRLCSLEAPSDHDRKGIRRLHEQDVVQQ